ncbi:MAG TPA: hypothetical protein VIO11_09800 [Candidatus Methanoperedens sp.]
MQLSEIPRKLVYAILFGFIGLILGIWTADFLYSLVLRNIERVTTIYLSMIIILIIVAAAAFVGFTKGKTLLE